ncbi:hypothetical protein E3P91_02376 [Wallemia ichthyophaga]|nr:hypothetical protein E3P91_02376 [Wallemia ichthyophaga]
MARSIEIQVEVQYTTSDNKTKNKLIQLPLNFNLSDENTDDEIINKFKPRINLVSNDQVNTSVTVNGMNSDVSWNPWNSRNPGRKRKWRDPEIAAEMADEMAREGPSTAPKSYPNPIISKHWQEFSVKTNLDKIYLSEHIIPLYKSFFGKSSLEGATNRNMHLLYKQDALVLLVEPTSSTLHVARIIDFDSIDSIKIRESKGKEPMFGFKLKPNSLVSIYLKQFNFNNDDWITLFPDSRHPLFLPDNESKLVYNLKLLAKKEKVEIVKLPDEQIVSLYHNCIS